MPDSVLVINAGSSSIKFALYEASADRPGARLLRGQIANIGGRALLEASDAHGESLAGTPRFLPAVADHDRALDHLLNWLARETQGARILAAGHRVVHGGAKYAGSIRIDPQVLDELQSLIPIARLHQPYEIDAIRALQAQHPDLCQVACFDTAFHRTLPDVAQRFALPRSISETGVRRYGFHGLSYTYIAEELRRSHAPCAEARVIVAHLGSGSSLCAMLGGRSVATTMGFTVLDGLMMGTRSGSLDPGVVLYLMQERGMSAEAVSEMLYRRSGLLGVSGLSANMAELLASPPPHAREAVDSYVYSVVKETGALAACLGGIDSLVFTAGIGERAAVVRGRICRELGWLGIEIDPRANETHERCISLPASRVQVWVIPTDEESIIARDALALSGH